MNDNGLCCLREAIQTAAQDAPVDGCPMGHGADTILLTAGYYLLTIAGANAFSIVR